MAVTGFALLASVGLLCAYSKGALGSGWYASPRRARPLRVPRDAIFVGTYQDAAVLRPQSSGRAFLQCPPTDSRSARRAATGSSRAGPSFPQTRHRTR